MRPHRGRAAAAGLCELRRGRADHRALSPHGHPRAGGLTFDEAACLLECVVRSGRRIIGFDLVEVVPSDDDRTDVIVGARMLYKLCGLTLKSNAR